MRLTLDSHLLLVPVVIRKDKKHFIVEDIKAGEFYEMPEICIEAINLINEGMLLGEIELRLKEKYPNNEVDLIAFVESLLEMNLIAKLDDEIIELKPVPKAPLGFLSISPRIGKLLFNKATYFVYSTLFLINLFLFIFMP